jgi:hypothetical protein
MRSTSGSNHPVAAEKLRFKFAADRRLWCTTLFVRFLVFVLESIQHSNPTYWSASSREPPRSTIGIAAVRTAIEYEYDEIRYEARSRELAGSNQVSMAIKTP